MEGHYGPHCLNMSYSTAGFISPSWSRGNLRLTLSAVVFCAPGRQAADIVTLWEMHQFHSFSASTQREGDLAPPPMIYVVHARCVVCHDSCVCISDQWKEMSVSIPDCPAEVHVLWLLSRGGDLCLVAANSHEKGP